MLVMSLMTVLTLGLLVAIAVHDLEHAFSA